MTTLTVTIAAACALALAACNMGPLLPEEPPELGGGRTCYVVDISGSTAAPRLDGNYRRSVFATAAINGMTQSGSLCFTFAAGGAVRGATVAWADVSADDPGNSDLAPGQVRGKVERATQSLDATLADPPPHSAGSQLFNAIAALQSRAALRAGDEIVFLSDMHERSAYLRVDRDDTFDPGIVRVLKKLRADHLLPDLTGVTLRAPHVNERGRIDSKGRVVNDSHISPGRLRRVERVWELYAEATGAKFVQTLPKPPIDEPAWVSQPRT